MRSSTNVFHLAIPTHDLDAAERFYCLQLGCRLARKYADRITLDFFGDQVVCHLDYEYEMPELRMYPRHFGITFREREEFDSLHARAKEREIHFFRDLFTRFEGEREEHRTFFLCDPSNNLLEFKWYFDPGMMY
jgi:extradiol dioxygenase family protein